MIYLKSQFILLFTLLFIFLSIKDSYSQTTIHSIGFDIGSLANVDHSFVNWVVFPEIFVSGDFFTSNFNWKTNLGYWNDGFDEFSNHYPTFSYSSFIFSAELLYLFPITDLNRPSPVRFISGLSYHYVTVKEIGNYKPWLYYSESYPKNLTGNLFYIHAGTEIHLLLRSNTTVFLKGVGYFLLNYNEAFKDNRWRFQFSLGVNYNFSL